ncbi:MAG: hypothetical protein COA41_01905 [Sphingopyxis sp.]|nr:MAG: hypothetical protein COA41_01905 [Sphingopyxis sp.]
MTFSIGIIPLLKAEKQNGNFTFMIHNIVQAAKTHKNYQWAWQNYEHIVQQIIESQTGKNVMEIGGGRFPTFDQAYVEKQGLKYTSNDISERELSLAPHWVQRAHFDVQTADESAIEPFCNQYDVCFSKMVMEHVESYDRAYKNIFRILRPGGMSIAFHPVLYTLPFLVNLAIPDSLSSKLLASVFPNRTDDGIPKFEAYYSGCRISQSVRDNIQSHGFSAVWQVPFYGHNYYSKFPIIRNIHSTVNDMIQDANISVLASFCYTIVKK